MLEFNLVGVHPLGNLDDNLRHRGPSLLLGTLNLVPLVTGLYNSLVRRVYITLLHITVFILFFGRLIVPETFSFKIGFL